jgi:2-polyprenyl-3-methyl-5-hydroxy-6-metoxy-1,4-benzoquinol methylase
MLSEEEEKAFYCNYNEHVKSRLVNPKESMEDQFEASLPEAGRRVSTIRDYLNSSMSILEIGSATGAFLHLIRGDVREVLGIEPSIAHATYMSSLGIPNVLEIAMLNMNNRDRFDGIALFHVFEHIRNPLSFLQTLRKKYLTKEGVLWVEVPNVDDALLTLYQCKPFAQFYYQAMHHYYYSAKTLQDVTYKAGFKTKELIPIQRYDLSNHLYWLQHGKPGGAGKYSAIFSQSLNAAYTSCLKEHFLCDTLLGIFQT